MMIKKQFIAPILMLAVFLFFVGCGKPFRESEEGYDKTKQKIQQIKTTEEAPLPPVVTKNSFYSDTKKIDEAENPRWVRERISIKVKRLPLSFVMSHLLRNQDAVVKYNPRVNKDRLVSLDYDGTVKGALEQLASQTNYAYDINCNELTWEAFVTKTFNVSFMPGSSTYVVGQTSATTFGGSGSGSSGGTSSGSSGVTATTGNLMSNDQQYSGLQAASLSVWTDLKKTLDELKSPDGKVSVSESTTMVTVYDRPSNVEAVEHYIKQLNKSMSKQVRLKVQVLELELDSAHHYGIDWNLMMQWFGTPFSVTSAAGSGANVAGSIAGQGISSFSTPSNIRIGSATGSNALLQALSTQGKLSVVTEPTVVTMNNQVAEIRISRDTGYLQNTSVSVVPNGGTTSSSLNPGVVTDGFILYLLPKIEDDKVFLEASSTLSSLISLVTVTSGGGGGNGSTTVPAQSIQVPTLSEKRFNIRSVVPNGNTLVIGGFKQTRNELRASKMFGVQALGGKGSQDANTETILLITPTIAASE